jgi:hypothetical protein
LSPDGNDVAVALLDMPQRSRCAAEQGFAASATPRQAGVGVAKRMRGCGRRSAAESATRQPAVSAKAHCQGVSRRQRQIDELRDLCRLGAVGRAIGLAFEHFADFGCDDGIIDLLADAIGRTGAPEDVRRRFTELRLSHH